MTKKEKRPLDWHNLSGKIPFRMTNDYLFRALMQTNNQVLTALIAAFLGWDATSITSATIENPIELGKSLDSKTFILDISVMINNRIMINLEMQVLNENNWPERSLVYLCRAFDSINRNENSQDLKPAYHIGITDFKLFPDYPEFYATYKLLNVKDFYDYTDKFRLSVLCLPYIDQATDEDKTAHLDEWAAMYKATRWEELQMLAQKNPDIDNAVTSIYSLSQDDLVQKQIQAREDYYTLHRSLHQLIADLRTERDTFARERDAALQSLDAKDKRIAELEALLAAKQS